MTTLTTGTYEWVEAHLGAAGELVMDSTNKDIVIHDGVTVGGFRILNRDNADQRYQARIPELDAFDNLSNNSFGYLVRSSVGQLRIAKMAVNDSALSITFANGKDGNTTIALKDSIAGARTFTGVITFNQQIVASGGVAGDITGNVTGNVTGNLTGNVTGNVQGNLTGDSTGNHVGGVDVRGASLQLDNDQIAIAKIAGLTAALGGVIPTGFIGMWAGTHEEIPAGWNLCDGTNGTPNLSERFIMGSSDTVNPNATGGATTHTHANTVDAAGGHTHSATVAGHAITESQMPAHSHNNGVTDQGPSSNLFVYGTVAASPTTPDSIDDNSSTGTVQGLTSSEGGGATHTHGITVDSANNHTHNMTNAAASSLPPYYALAFIQKG